MGSLDEKDNPREALRWYWEKCRRFWGTIVELDAKFHDSLYGQYPRTMRFGGDLLRGFYGVCVSPAFAVVLTLLLVGLVISGVVPIIFSISVFAAWLVTILSLARNERVNKLSIVRRLVLVFGVAAIAAVVANRYVRWCLANYYKSQPTVSVVATPHDDLDKLAYQRLKEIIDQEMPKFMPRSPGKYDTFTDEQIASQAIIVSLDMVQLASLWLDAESGINNRFSGMGFGRPQTPSEKKRVSDEWTKAKRKNSKEYQARGKPTITRANELRILMLSKLPPWMKGFPEDKKEQDQFVRLLSGDCGFLDVAQAASYLRDLANRNRLSTDYSK